MQILKPCLFSCYFYKFFNKIPTLKCYWIFWLKLEVWCDILYCVTYPISVTDRRCLYGFIHHFTRSCPGRRDDAHHLPMDGRELVTVNQDSKIQDKRTPGSRTCRGFSCFIWICYSPQFLTGIYYSICTCRLQYAEIEIYINLKIVYYILPANCS